LLLIFSFPLGAQELFYFQETPEGRQGSPARDDILALLPDDTFELQLENSEPYTVVLDSRHQQANGDLTWTGFLRETGIKHTFIMTAGESALHASLTSPDGVYQYYGRRAALSDTYSGFLRRYTPQRADLPDTDIIQRLPDDESATPDTEITTFAISQRSSKRVRAGGTVTFSVSVTNAGNTSRPGVTANVYFVLENSTLVQAPGNCARLFTSADEPVLSCQLGTLTAGETRTFDYSVATSLVSHPNVLSTVVVDVDRNDLFVDVYRDVVTDTDEDGVSDFNESLLGSNPEDGLDEPASTHATIDILALYTPEAAALYEQAVTTRINHLVSVANDIYHKSDVALTLRLVEVAEVPYVADASLAVDLAHLTYQSDAAFSNLQHLRRASGADLVVLLRPRAPDSNACGLANLGGRGTQGDFTASYQKDFAFSVINIDCLDDSVLAHEISHNMGLVHSRLEDPEGGTLPHAAGYGVDGQFVTVMAYPGDFATDNRVFRFSNPDQFCAQFSFPCGRERSDPDTGADAAAVLNLVKHQIAAYYPSLEQRLTPMPLTSTTAGETTAQLRGGITLDDSETFTTLIGAASSPVMTTVLTPAPAHVGRLAVKYLVIRYFAGEDAIFLQLNTEGELLPWDGKLGNLIPATTAARLLETERYSLLRTTDLGTLLATNKRLSFYSAYKLLETNELLYTTRAHNVDVVSQTASLLDSLMTP
jgi:hypothetical protein